MGADLLVMCENTIQVELLNEIRVGSVTESLKQGNSFFYEEAERFVRSIEIRKCSYILILYFF